LGPGWDARLGTLGGSRERLAPPAKPARQTQYARGVSRVENTALPHAARRVGRAFGFAARDKFAAPALPAAADAPRVPPNATSPRRTPTRAVARVGVIM